MFLALFKLLRQLLAWVDFILFTLFLYGLSWLPFPPGLSWYRALFRRWCWVFIHALNVELYRHQHHRQPLPEQYILIGNHPSVLEDLGMSALFKAFFLAKVEVKSWFIVGRIGYKAGTLYVKREEKESRHLALESLEAALIKGYSVGLYPEGGCKGRRLWFPFLFGAFQLSIKTGIPIVPVFLHYESQEDFEWQGQTLLKKLWEIMRSPNRRANYYVFDAIDPKQFKTMEEMCQYVQVLYGKWQARFLE